MKQITLFLLLLTTPFALYGKPRNRFKKAAAAVVTTALLFSNGANTDQTPDASMVQWDNPTLAPQLELCPAKYQNSTPNLTPPKVQPLMGKIDTAKENDEERKYCSCQVVRDGCNCHEVCTCRTADELNRENLQGFFCCTACFLCLGWCLYIDERDRR